LQLLLLQRLLLLLLPQARELVQSGCAVLCSEAMRLRLYELRQVLPASGLLCHNNHQLVTSISQPMLACIAAAAAAAGVVELLPAVAAGLLYVCG
jgi:hypothetical protein